jgi:hypothetical protein
VANVDKGFVHFVKHFRNDREVTAAIQVSEGRHGEYGWGVYFEQGRHRSILAGTVANRPDEEAWEDALWIACAKWACFEPVLGQPKVHQEKLWTAADFTGVFQEWESLGDPSCIQAYQTASPYRKEQMERFSVGIRKFHQAFTWELDSEGAPVWAMGYSQRAAASRRFRVSDGPDLWSQGQVKFVPPVPQSAAPGTSPKSIRLLQVGGRVFGGPGEAGTGSSVSAPD